MTGLIIDIILLAVVVLTVIISAKQGFVKVLLGLVGMILAFVVASHLSTVASEFIFDKMIAPTAKTSITKTIENLTDESTDGVLEVLPKSVYSAAEVFNVDLKAIIEQNVETSVSESAEAISEAVVEKVARPFLTSIVQMILFIILFVLIFVLIKLITKAIDLVAKLPVLKTANKTLGALLGFAKGVLFVYIICFILKLSINFIDGGIFGIDEEILEASRIASLFWKI